MIKTRLFIKGCSGECAPAFSNRLHPCTVLKKRGNAEHGLLSHPLWANLKGLYSALLISIREQPLSSINALPLSLLIFAETNI